MNSKQAQERVTASARRHARSEEGSQSGAGMFPMWPAVPWMNPWFELWTTMWSGWLGYGVQRHPGAARPAAGGERRREDGLPWVPKVETTVIPLRRRTDPPGQQADRISMRMQVPSLPWLGGENVIAFDAVVPRSRGNGAQPEAGGSGPGAEEYR